MTPPPALEPVTAQILAAAPGGLLLTAVLALWRRSVSGIVVMLALQGACLAALGVGLAILHDEPELLAVSLLVFAVKGVAVPVFLHRCTVRVGAAGETSPLVNPALGMLLAAGLITVAYLVSRPLQGAGEAGLLRAVPVGIAVVLIGFLVVITRRQTLTQVAGYVMVDNGISSTALLTAGSLPVVVELGVLVDVVLVVAILLALTGRIRATFGTTELHELSELRD